MHHRFFICSLVSNEKLSKKCLLFIFFYTEMIKIRFCICFSFFMEFMRILKNKRKNFEIIKKFSIRL